MNDFGISRSQLVRDKVNSRAIRRGFQLDDYCLRVDSCVPYYRPTFHATQEQRLPNFGNNYTSYLA